MSTTATKIKPASGKSTTMYEVDDANKMSDKGYARSYGDNGHGEKFKDFIASLGFDVTRESTSIIIDGEKFDVNFNKVSYLAQNRFTRNWNPRADRCIEITRSWDSVLVKIPFNVEIDRDKLVAKIKNEIDERMATEKAIADKENNHLIQLEAMRKHYFGSNVISSMVKSISIQSGILSLNVEEIGFIEVDATTGKFIEFIPNEVKSLSLKEVANWSLNTTKKEVSVLRINNELEKLGAVGAEFSKFAKTAHRGSATKNKIDKY
jgi:hypothetical protein